MTLKKHIQKLPAVLLIAVAFFALAGAANQPAPKGQTTKNPALKLPAVKIDNLSLDLEYISSALASSGPSAKRDFADPVKRGEVLDRIVNMEILAGEAKKRGYDQHSEIQSAYKNQLASLMHRQIADNLVETEPSEEALRAYYDKNNDKYNKPEKMRARHILISDQAKAEKLLENVLSRNPSQHEFKRLAQENSEDETTRLRGGDLTFFSMPDQKREGDPQVDPALATAAFTLKENGEIYSKLVKGSKGYHVIMRTGHRDKMALGFEKAKDRLQVLVRRELKKTQIEDAVDALKNHFPVQIFEENLKDVVIDLSSGPPKPDAKGGLTPKERERRAKQMITGRKLDDQVKELQTKIKK